MPQLAPVRGSRAARALRAPVVSALGQSYSGVDRLDARVHSSYRAPSARARLPPQTKGRPGTRRSRNCSTGRQRIPYYLERITAAVHEQGLGVRVVFPEGAQAAEVARPDPRCIHHLDRPEARGAVENKVHLGAGFRAPEAQAQVLAGVVDPRAQVLRAGPGPSEPRRRSRRASRGCRRRARAAFSAWRRSLAGSREPAGRSRAPRGGAAGARSTCLCPGDRKGSSARWRGAGRSVGERERQQTHAGRPAGQRPAVLGVEVNDELVSRAHDPMRPVRPPPARPVESHDLPLDVDVRYKESDFRYSRNGAPRSSRFRANSTVAFRNPSLLPASWRVPVNR
jgi:hypothetical protein